MQMHYTYERGRLRKTYERLYEETLIEKLSRWQRRQWQLAGSPKDIASLLRFGRLQRDGTELWAGDVIPPNAT